MTLWHWLLNEYQGPRELLSSDSWPATIAHRCFPAEIAALAPLPNVFRNLSRLHPPPFTESHGQVIFYDRYIMAARHPKKLVVPFSMILMRTQFLQR